MADIDRLQQRKAMFMKIFKHLALISLAIISVIGVSGCMLSKPDRADIAKKLLKEKYNEDFTVFTSGKGYGTLTNNTFTVVAAPKDNEDLKFEAEIEKEGDWMIDEYVQALLEDEIKKIVSNKIKNELTDDFFIKVYIGWSDTKITNKNSVSLDAYMKKQPNVPVVIDVLFNKNTMANIDSKKEYEVFADLFAKDLPFTSTLEIYYTSMDVVQKSEEYFKKHAEAYDDFDKMVEGSLEIGIGITNGKLNISSSEFIKQRQVK